MDFPSKCVPGSSDDDTTRNARQAFIAGGPGLVEWVARRLLAAALVGRCSYPPRMLANRRSLPLRPPPICRRRQPLRRAMIWPRSNRWHRGILAALPPACGNCRIAAASLRADPITWRPETPLVAFTRPSGSTALARRGQGRGRCRRLVQGAWLASRRQAKHFGDPDPRCRPRPMPGPRWRPMSRGGSDDVLFRPNPRDQLTESALMGQGLFRRRADRHAGLCRQGAADVRWFAARLEVPIGSARRDGSSWPALGCSCLDAIFSPTGGGPAESDVEGVRRI